MDVIGSFVQKALNPRPAGRWFQRAGGLPGRTLHVALALAQNARLAGKEQFRIRPSLIASIGVNRSTLYRSLVRMQEASLLEVVEKGPGRSPTIRLLDIVPEGCTW